MARKMDSWWIGGLKWLLPSPNPARIKAVLVIFQNIDRRHFDEAMVRVVVDVN